MATLASEEFFIVVPAEATNEVTNPSVETATTGYTAVGAGVAIARSSTYQRRGLYSLEVTPAAGVQSGFYYGTVNEVASASRTFSVDVYNPTAGQAMRIGIYTTAGAMLSETTFTSNGYWQRISVTRTGSASTTRRLYVLRDSVASAAKFYVDGLYYSSVDGTYLDGDMKGFLTNTVEYRWNGAAHASTSWRSSQTRSGGTMVRIKDYARILLTLGLGMATVTNIAQQLAADYSSYQTSRINNREIVLGLALVGTTPGAIQANRQALINAVRPDVTAVRQPLLIRYQGLDSSGGDASEPVDITCHYVDGLQDQPPIPGLEKCNMRFQSFLPFIQNAGESGVGLGYNTTVANFANIGYRDIDGQWKAMGTGVDDYVNAFTVGPDNYLYAGGNFGSAGGVANTAYLAKWSGAAWESIGGGNLDGQVNALAMGADGTLYAAGTFANIGASAFSNIAKWNGAAWSALGTGVTGGSGVDAMLMSQDGILYVGGEFTQMGGIANTARIAKWDGAAWSALGTGMDDQVHALAIGKDGTLYAGGAFHNAGGTLVNHVAKWNGTAWSAMGTTGVDDNVNALAVGREGTLYAGGNFHNVETSTSAYHLAKWNGVQWSAMGAGVNDIVWELAVDNAGLLWIGGVFTQSGAITFPDRGALYFSGGYFLVDIDVQDVAAEYSCFAFDQHGRVFLGGNWAGTDALSATVSATATGNAGQGAYPSVVFTGPGKMWQLKNYTNGKAIYFSNLTLLAGEKATLDLRRGKVSFKSSFRGDLSRYIMAGSSLDWHLETGSNNVSSYMTGTTAASSIVMIWQDSYWSIDGAKR